MKTVDKRRKNEIRGTDHAEYGKTIVREILQQDGLDRDIPAFETAMRKVNGKYYLFIIDRLKKGYAYSCTPDDVCRNLAAVPPGDLMGLNLVIFYQPKTKEDIRDGSWGRVVYDYQHGSSVKPAVILEAVDISREQRIPKTADPSDREEIRQLTEEGHTFTDMGAYYLMKSTMEAVRRTQLDRTLFHEIGHYYDSIRGIARNHRDKEAFANGYAKRMQEKLKEMCD